MLTYTIPREQPTAHATSSMDICRSLRLIYSTCCTVASVDTSAGRPRCSRSLMLCLHLLNSWIQLNTVFSEKQLSPYTGCISRWTSSVDSPLAHKKRTTAHCSTRVHSCNTPAIVLWLPLTDHVPKRSDTIFTTSVQYICCHLLTNNECIMYKWYQGYGHLRLIYWLALVF